MAIQKSYQSKESDFNAEVNIDITYLNVAANKARLVTTPAAVDALTKATALLPTYNANLQLCNNSSASTTTTVATKNTNASSIEKYLRIIIGDIPQSLLTQSDYDTLQLSSGVTKRTAAKKPVSTPVISITEHKHLSITINVADIQQPNKKAKPDDANGIEVEVATIAATATITTTVPADNQFNHVANSGKTKIELQFKAEQIKSTIYIRARYYNASDNPGNWSEVISTIVI